MNQAMLKEFTPGGDTSKHYKVNFIMRLKDYGISLNESMRARALYDNPNWVDEAIDEAIEMAEEIRLKAERRGGGILKEQVRKPEETNKKITFEGQRLSLTLKEMEITY